jgi:hypothetical protein
MMAHVITEHVMQETGLESVILTFPVFGRSQRMALAALNKYFANSSQNLSGPTEPYFRDSITSVHED